MIGVFLPYVMYITPVLDKQLHEMASFIHDKVIEASGSDTNGLHISKFYHPDIKQKYRFEVVDTEIFPKS